MRAASRQATQKGITILLVYGCGSMGTRIASLASESGFDTVLAGRPSARLAATAESLNIPWRGSVLANPDDLDRMLQNVRIVINTAGPFTRTAGELMRACLKNRCHYLDLSNEPRTFQDAWSLDDDARRAGVALVPGAGFGTAATQALAARVVSRIHEPDTLTIVCTLSPEGQSPGVGRTALEILSQPASGFTEGKWRVLDSKVVCFDLPAGRRAGVPVGLGDAFATSRATGIPNVKSYATTTMNPTMARFTLPLARQFIRAVRLSSWPAPRARAGIDAEQRGSADIQVWMQAANPQGQTATSCIHGDDGNELAARIAILAAQQLRHLTIAGTHTAGELVPSQKILDLPGLRVTDL